jgi:hypothetical protein
MYSFRVNGHWLMMYPGGGTQLELQHPLVAENFEEPWSMPIEVPIAGNEMALNFVHTLALAVRHLRVDDVELWKDGIFKHRGVFTVEGSSEESITLTFSVDGFLTQLKDVQLRELDYGPDILLPGLFDDSYTREDAMTYANKTTWPNVRFCFPMMRNKDAYSDNPDWWKDGDEWKASETYSPTGGEGGTPDIIRYTPDEVVRRERIYTCIAGTSAGQHPDNSVGKFDARGQGIINPWSGVDQVWLSNSSGEGGRYAISPQFYLKDILIRAMASQGYNAVGDFIDDPLTHRVIVYNNTLLDEAVRDNYVLATLTNDLVVPAGHWFNDLSFPPDDDFTAPNEDNDGLYNVGVFTPPATGYYAFHARIITHSATPCRHWVGILKNDNSSPPVWSGYTGVDDLDLRTNWDFTVAPNSAIHLEGGVEYRVVVTAPLSYQYLYNSHEFTIEAGSFLEWWTGQPSILNGWGNSIHMADHVPDMSVRTFLDEIRKSFYLRITPDVVTRTIRFDYNQDVLLRPIGRDITEELAGPISLDHSQRIFGIRIRNARGRPDDLPDLRGSTPSVEHTFVVTKESTLTPATVPNEKLRVLNTGQIYQSRVYNTNQIGWFPIGHYLPDAEYGDQSDPLVIEPAFGAPMMSSEIGVDNALYMIPIVDEPASSKLYNQGYNAPSLLLMHYLGNLANDKGYKYPCASPYMYHTGGAFYKPVSFSLTHEHWLPRQKSYTLNTTFAEPWLNRWVNAEVWRCDLDVGRLLTRNGCVLERLQCKNQEVILHTLPVEYDDGEGTPLIAREARLLKLPRDPGALGRDGQPTTVRR